MKVRTLHRPECPDLPAIPRNVELQGFVLENVLNGSPGPNTTSTNMGTSRKTGPIPKASSASGGKPTAAICCHPYRSRPQSGGWDQPYRHVFPCFAPRT